MAPLPERIGRYKILERIGEGRLTTVYRAQDAPANRDVAIKVLPAGANDSTALERFIRETQIVRSLHHPNIATVYEADRDRGTPFVAMEYVPGETLAEFIAHHRRVNMVRKLRIMEQVCAGVGYAHQHGIVHRDIKPRNVMVAPGEVVKVMDFGLAHLAAAFGDTDPIGLPVGTASYMAPEMLAGTWNVEPRVDVFSVGAVFYELICDRVAFPGDTLSETIQNVLRGTPVPIDSLVRDLDADLVGVMNGCLEKHPEKRPRDLIQVARTVAAIRSRLERRGGDTHAHALLSYPRETAEVSRISTRQSEEEARQQLEAERIRRQSEQREAEHRRLEAERRRAREEEARRDQAEVPSHDDFVQDSKRRLEAKRRLELELDRLRASDSAIYRGVDLRRQNASNPPEDLLIADRGREGRDRARAHSAPRTNSLFARIVRLAQSWISRLKNGGASGSAAPAEKSPDNHWPDEFSH
jgi:serine/threonine protein kinase